jgi:ATP-dependent helicase/nuclease subunit B
MGRAIWHTPEIQTWESWLSLQWRRATLMQPMHGGVQLLSQSQERALWESALRLAGGEDPEALLPHGAALMRAASQACQSLLQLSRTASTDEERLLVAVLGQVRELCRTRGLLSLNLASADELGFLAGCKPPAVVGQQQLTPLQQRLQQICWPEAQLLLEPDSRACTPALVRVAHLDAEMAACARWCLGQLHDDGARRLLVISAWQDPGAQAQGAMLWRALADGHVAQEAHRQELLAVEGGEPLHHQALVADALLALATPGGWIETTQLQGLLRSRYLHFGTAGECADLALRLGQWGLARWRAEALQEALARVSGTSPAGARLQGWLDATRNLLGEIPRRGATAWAERFSHCLASAGFVSAGQLDSRDAQRLVRWGELLDEFAGLDATLPPMTAEAALQNLRRLAQQSVHQGATGDAAITFTTQMQDPVAAYDGIWVMGLTESRWPLPPRPDPYVPLHEQRRCDWPQAGVTQRLRAAQWLQQRWQDCTDNLVLSYARNEGDVRHRPSALLARAGWTWTDSDTPERRLPAGAEHAASDRSLPPMTVEETAQPLRGGVERLRIHQECAFHAQAQWRLGAAAPERLTDGIPAKLRGMLLHSLLEGLWGELKDQQNLLAMTPELQHELISRHWDAAVRDNRRAGVDWMAEGVLELERQRAALVVDRVLKLECERAPFTVRMREHEVLWRLDAAALTLRIDRVDETATGALLVDYKSGAAGTIRLHKGEARPLQLAAYVVAMSTGESPVDGALLLSLKPAQLGYSGAADEGETLPRRVKPVPDWPQAVGQWQLELQQLVTAHLAGSARLADSSSACEYCHLPAFCRRRALGDVMPAEEPVDE